MIGSNLVHGLNAIGIDDIIAVDDLTDGPKYRNLLGAQRSATTSTGATSTRRFAAASSARSTPCCHQGACSDTMEHDGRFMMRHQLPLLEDAARRLPGAGHAAAVRLVGGHLRRQRRRSARSPQFEQPLNVYGYSKLLFDNVVRRALPTREARRSPAFATSTSTARASSTRAAWRRWPSTSSTSSRDTGKVKLFGEYGGYGAGEQSRDFVFVDDVVAVNLWFLEHPAGERHLQPRHRPGAAVQRRRAGRRQRRRARRRARRRCR